MVTRYQKRISGPLLDRIDIHIEVPRVEYEKLSDDRLGEPSAAVRARVEAARERQRQRFAGTRLLSNADMGPAEVRDHCGVDDAGKSLLRAAFSAQGPKPTSTLKDLTEGRFQRVIPDGSGGHGSCYGVIPVKIFQVLDGTFKITHPKKADTCVIMRKVGTFCNTIFINDIEKSKIVSVTFKS